MCSDGDSSVPPYINAKTRQGFSDVKSVTSDIFEMKNNYKPATKLSQENNKAKEEVIDDAELDLKVTLRD